METPRSGQSSRARKLEIPTQTSDDPPAGKITVLVVELPPREHLSRALLAQGEAEQGTSIVEVRTTKKPRERRKPKISPFAREALAVIPIIQARADEIIALVDRYRDTPDVAFAKAIGVIGSECSQTFRSLLSPELSDEQPTLLHETRRRTQRADAKKRELARLSVELKSLAHDLKNVGHSITGYAELMGEGISTPKHLDRLEQVAVRMKALTARFAAEVSGHSADRSMVSIRDVIDRVVEERKLRLEAEGIALHASIEDELITMAPSGDLERTIDNFVLNAAEAMSDQAGAREISIRAIAHQEQIEVRVSDTGPGVPPEVLARLFADAITTKATGHGIGTLGAAQTIRALGGDIGAESEVGQGASFWFRLPRWTA